MKAERALQPPFSFVEHAQTLGVAALVMLAAHALPLLPDRTPLPQRTSAVQFEPVRLGTSGFQPAKLAGAWRLTSADPRFGGFSGLAFDRGQLLGLTDSGAVARFSKPGDAASGAVVMTDLPDGPGEAGYRINRDTEALVPDAGGRGWWASFEQANEIWLYSADFTKALKRLQFGKKRWPENAGIEGMSWANEDLLLAIEDAPAVFRLHGSRAVGLPFSGRRHSLSEASRLPDGRLVMTERSLTWRGFRNALLILSEERGGYGVARRLELPVGRLDNLEGLAAERLPTGAIRLWMISDDNFQRPLRTLLIAIDMPPESDRP
jgi:hypothetical protein